MTFGSIYQEIGKIEGLKNLDSTVFIEHVYRMQILLPLSCAVREWTGTYRRQQWFKTDLKHKTVWTYVHGTFFP